MTPSPSLERSAAVIAANVVSAFHRRRRDVALSIPLREDLAARIVRELLAVMPTGDGAALAVACNRALDDAVGPLGLSSPRVEAIDPDDGSVTMRAG